MARSEEQQSPSGFDPNPEFEVIMRLIDFFRRPSKEPKAEPPVEEQTPQATEIVSAETLMAGQIESSDDGVDFLLWMALFDKKVLLIDDNVDSNDIFSKILTRLSKVEPNNLRIARSIGEAKIFLEEQTFDVIITDFRLDETSRDQNCIDILEYLKKLINDENSAWYQQPSPEVIISSVLDMSAIEEEYLTRVKNLIVFAQILSITKPITSRGYQAMALFISPELAVSGA